MYHLDVLRLLTLWFCVGFSAGGGGGGTVAKDALGNDIKLSAYLATHKAKDYSLAQGLKVLRH